MIQIAGYFIKREVGSGGMATVYLAVQTSLEREVALKVMTPALVNDPNFSRRFLMEARTLASLSHPNIVAVYDVGVTDTQLHYFSMQHLPGGDFAKRIADGVNEAEVIRVLIGVARALAFAHLRGFVHRDVSPANILFDATGNPILTDFGIARAVTRTSRLTNAGVSVGTSHYMSPEQARGGSVDARSDLYSLGAVAFEALTGKPPYEGEDGFAIAYAHVFEPVPRLPQHLQHWQALIDRALAKDPNERFGDVEEFAQALEAIAEKVGTSTAPRFPSPETVPRTENIPSVSDMSLAANTVMPTRPAVTPTPTSEAVTPLATPAVTSDVAAAATPAPPVAGPVSGRSMAPAWIAIGIGVLGLGVALWFALRSATPAADSRPAVEPGATTVATTPARRDPPPRESTVTPPASTVAMDTPPASGTAFDPLADPSAATTTIDPVTGDPLLPGTDGTGLAADGVTPVSPDEQAALQQAVATTVQDPLPVLLAIGRSDIQQRRLSTPPGRNALERFAMAQKLAERFKDEAALAKAKEGVVATAQAYVELAEDAFTANKQGEFLDFLKRAEDIALGLPEGNEVVQAIVKRRNGLRDAALTEGRTAVAAWNREAALSAYQRALVYDAGSQEATRGLRAAERIGQPGYVFRDAYRGGGQGPEMVVVQAGSKRVAFARAETTLAEFRASGAARGERPSCRDRESIFRSSRKYTFEAPDLTQGADHPVVCVSFADAERYAAWLSEKTGQRYRLPTAAEWRAVAARVKAGECTANVADSRFNAQYRDSDAWTCDDGFAATAPVRRFAADASGLYDVAGNAREWISDCAPGCREHAALGSAWSSTREKPDVAQQVTLGADTAANTIGFRVVREVP